MDDELIVSVLLACIIVLSADIFRRVITEFIRIQHHQKSVKIMRRLQKPVQPWVTIVLYGDTAGLETTLRSLKQSRYHNYDVSVVGPRAHTYQTAYRKSKRGKIVIPLPIGVQVDPQFIKRAIAMKNDRRTWGVGIEKSEPEAATLFEIIKRLQNVLWMHPKKIEVFISADVMKKRIPKKHSILPALPEIITQGITIGLIVTGIIYSDLLVLWYAWVLISAYVLVLVWLSNTIRLSERVSLSIAVPSALFLIPVASIIEGFFQLSTRK